MSSRKKSLILLVVSALSLLALPNVSRAGDWPLGVLYPDTEATLVDPIHGNPTPPFPLLGDGHHVRVEDEVPGGCVNVTYSFTWTPSVIAFFGGADVSSPAQKARVRDAFTAWNAVTPGIQFTEVVGAPATISVGTAADFFALPPPFFFALGLGGGLSLHHAPGPDIAANHHLHDHLAVQNGLAPWHNGAGLPPGGLFDYLTVATQEVGHAIGLGHNEGDLTSVMFPFLSPGIRRTANAADKASLDILYEDTTPPEVACSVAVDLLWPPNHNLMNVGLDAIAIDCDEDAAIEVLVFADEDDDEPTGDGKHSPDAKDIDLDTLRLRSERKGNSDGRVYLIVVIATDDSGNEGFDCCTVVVPKSKSKKHIADVDAQAAAAEFFCLLDGEPPLGFVEVGDGATIGPKQ